MKRINYMFTLLLAAISTSIFAQAPQGMNYQAVARSSSGSVLANQHIALRITITDGSGGTTVYQETDTTTTNQFGLFTLNIGNGIATGAPFNSVLWGTITAWMEVEMDAAGGTSYVSMGSSQLLSVPYALYSASGGTSYTAGSGIDVTANTISNTIDSLGNLSDVNTTGVDTGQTLKWNGSNWVAADDSTGGSLNGTTNYIVKFTGANSGGISKIYDNGTNIGIGTTTPTTQAGGQIGLEIKGNVPQIVLNDDGGTQEDFRILNGGAFATFDNATTNTTLMSFGLANNRNNVGIGTTAPGSRLDIQTIDSTGAFKNVEMLHVYAPNLADSNAVNFYLGKSGTSNNQLELRYNHIANGSANNFVSMGMYGTPGTFNLTGSGNVGIGTAIPGERLHIENNGDVYAKIHATTGSGQIAGLKLQRGAWATDGFSDWTIYNQIGELYFAKHSSSGTFVRMYINDQSGNVGIGTTAPVAKLELSGAGSATEVFRFSNNKDGTLDSAMVMTGSGNVGIGTATPAAKLDVIGEVKIEDGTQGDGKILTSDANGLASWQNKGAIAYGVTDGAIVNGGFGITSVTHPSVGNYTITCSANLPPQATVVCNWWDTNGYGFISYYQSGGNTILIRTRNAAGADVDCIFSFIVFGN